jgi:hypothetical protein
MTCGKRSQRSLTQPDVGVRVQSDPSGTDVFRNNVVVDNTVGLEAVLGAAPAWDHNLVFGNTTNYSGYPEDPEPTYPDLTGTSGNISADPSVDFDGKPRPAQSIDMAAFQSQTGTTVPEARCALVLPLMGMLVGGTALMMSRERSRCHGTCGTVSQRVVVRAARRA